MAAKKKQPSIEEKFAQLDEIIALLEQDDTNLAEALDGYAKGVALIQSCQEMLDDVEKQMIILEDAKTGENDEESGE